MRKFFKILGLTLGVVVVLGLGFLLWAWIVANNRYERAWTVKGSDFPVPFPLSDAELSELRLAVAGPPVPTGDPLAAVDLKKVALDRAVARGKHLVESRLGCDGCHAKDFGGSVVVEAAILGRWVAPNLTTGAGSVTKDMTPAQWDLAVRHAIRHNGQSSSMPSIEFTTLSDRELSDAVAYIRSRPPVDRDLGPVKLGPLFAVMTATDKAALSAFVIDHEKPHPVEPPPPAPNAALGEHIVQVCRGCHGEQLSGGPMQGDPNMPVVANITPHATGLKGWSEADFLRALREGKRKDGTTISDYMPWKAYGQMSDIELRAIWAYLQTVPAIEKGNH